MQGQARPQLQMDAKQLWQAVLGDMQVRLSRTAFDNWLRQTSLIGFADDVATVAAANTFSASTLQTRYAAQVERVLSDIVGRPVRVRFAVLNADAEADADDAAPDDDTAALVAAGARTLFGDAPTDSSLRRSAVGGGIGQRGHGTPTRSRPHGLPSAPRRGTGPPASPPPVPNVASPKQMELTAAPTHGLNPRYVYENYVVGSSNRFAHAASLSVAERPGGKFNPFYVHGGVGLGKTHLIHAIGHRALELQAHLHVVYVSSEKFTNDLINALRARADMEEFRNRYRTIDILIVDDIQFIAGKESTQEEFFHTFNALYQSGKQVIITSDRPPKSISALEDRLRSRFEGGLIADVQLPDYEMRTAILRTKGEEHGVALPADVIEYIAQKDQTNIRELEGALNKILALSQIADRPLTLQLAMEALTDAAVGARRAKTTPEGVVDAVAGFYGVSHKDLRGRARTKEIVLPRQVAMFLLREETESSLVDIGQVLGGRDHTTVMHGIKQIEKAQETDTGLRSQLMAIREALFTAATT